MYSEYKQSFIFRLKSLQPKKKKTQTNSREASLVAQW